MGFYFVVYTFIGIATASANILVMEGRRNSASVPLWVHRKGPIFVLLGMSACILALLTSLINHRLTWTAVSVAELALGFMIAWMAPMGLRAFITITSPFSLIFILGALWGFWRI